MCYQANLSGIGPLYLPDMDDTMAELADVLLIWGEGSKFLCHSQILAAKSSMFSNLVSIALNSRDPESKNPLEISIGNSAPDFVKNCSIQAIFLQHLYSYDDIPITEVDQKNPRVQKRPLEIAIDLARLADWFGAPHILRSIERWACAQAIVHLQRPTNSSVDDLCQIFELAMNHRLTRLAALLLPWVLQRLNRGPLADASCPVWKDVQIRLTRLQKAMGPDIKSLALDMQFWSCGMPQRCDKCNCRSGDLALVVHPSYLASLGAVSNNFAPSTNSCTSHNVPRLPESYLSVSAHVAHVLEEGAWGRTPAVGLCGNLRPQ